MHRRVRAQLLLVLVLILAFIGLCLTLTVMLPKWRMEAKLGEDAETKEAIVIDKREIGSRTYLTYVFQMSSGIGMTGTYEKQEVVYTDALKNLKVGSPVTIRYNYDGDFMSREFQVRLDDNPDPYLTEFTIGTMVWWLIVFFLGIRTIRGFNAGDPLPPNWSAWSKSGKTLPQYREKS